VLHLLPLLLLVVPAGAAELSLPELLAEAGERNPTIQAARARQQARAQRRPQVTSLPDPKLSLAVQLERWERARSLEAHHPNVVAVVGGEVAPAHLDADRHPAPGRDQEGRGVLDLRLSPAPPDDDRVGEVSRHGLALVADFDPPPGVGVRVRLSTDGGLVFRTVHRGRARGIVPLPGADRGPGPVVVRIVARRTDDGPERPAPVVQPAE